MTIPERKSTKHVDQAAFIGLVIASARSSVTTATSRMPPRSTPVDFGWLFAWHLEAVMTGHELRNWLARVIDGNHFAITERRLVSAV